MDIRAFFQPTQNAPLPADDAGQMQLDEPQQHYAAQSPQEYMEIDTAPTDLQPTVEQLFVSVAEALPKTLAVQQKRWNVFNCTRHMSLYSRLPGVASVHLEQQYCWHKLQQVHSWDIGNLPASFSARPDCVPQLGVPVHVTCNRFDTLGQLLLAGTSTGVVGLWNWGDVQRSIGRNDPAAMLVLHTGLKLSDIQWNPINQAEAAVCGHMTDTISLYDLEVCENRPTKRLKGFAANCQAVMQYGYSGRFTAVATGPSANGQVALWDERKGVKPCAKLQAPADAQRLTSLAVLPRDDTVLAAGSAGNRIVLWDLRGGRGGALQLSAQGASSYPVLRTISVRDSMIAHDELLAQGTLDDSAVLQLAVCAREPFHVALRTARGWTGVMDLLTGSLTHLHAPISFRDLMQDIDPADTRIDPQYVADLHRRYDLSAYQQGAWSHIGRHFVAPAALSNTMNVLDFSSDPGSAALLLGSGAAEVHSLRTYVRSSHVHVPLQSQALTVQVHPVTQQVVWGDATGSLHVMDSRGVARR